MAKSKSPSKPAAKAGAKSAAKSAKSAKPAKAEPEKTEKKPAKTPLLTTGGLIPPDYDPVKDKSAFMNPVMKEFFRQKLIAWREELLRESSETIHNTLQGTELQKPDMADRASAETDHALELRTRDRERKLISKINEALLRIEDDSYGFCEETGEPISVARLVARPTATLSLEAQERHERMEKTHRDD
jgi:DnaK suppressor protein